MAMNDRPTQEQLALLRRVAHQKGQTFAYPTSRRAASQELERLMTADS